VILMQMGKEFFIKAFEEDSSDVEQVEDTPNEEVATEKVETVVPAEVVTEEVAPVVDEVVEVPKFTIDGEEYTVDQIKEWKQNGLRQSDYTKKTQELAEQRKALKADDSETPEHTEPTDSDRLSKLEKDLLNRELDLEITSLKQKYPDFDEVKVLDECANRGIYNDLEFIYKAIREDSKAEPIDMEAYKAQAIADYKTQIATEKQNNKKATSGSIISSTPGQPVVDYSEQLTSSEKEYALHRGWSDKEYVDMKNATY
jgi:hypothetical protein